MADMLAAGVVADLVVVDQPYNIGFDYGDEYADNMKPAEYEAWCHAWLSQLYYVLKPEGSLWLAIGDEWAAEMKVLCREVGFHLRSWVLWYYTFGINSPRKFTRSHAHWLYFTKHKKKFTFNADQVRVPSARALVYNDKRANPDGRLPDDTWILRPQELGAGFRAEGDTWHIPRIAGTFKQREDGAANQIPEQLLGRIIRACSNPGDIVFDPMAGTGSTLVVAKKLGRKYIGCELSEVFARRAQKRIRGARKDDVLDGPIPQGG